MHSPTDVPGAVRLLLLTCAFAGCKVYDESRLELANQTRLGRVSAGNPASTTVTRLEPSCAAGTGGGCDAPTLQIDASVKSRDADVTDEDAATNIPHMTADTCTTGINCPCGASSPDKDGDGRPDCQDDCPDDPTKRAAGSCGCGKPDTDSDGDRVPDCDDKCPSNASKTAAGSCGCAAPETDDDRDGTANCIDSCPSDSHKTQPGLCGCGVSDPVVPSMAGIGGGSSSSGAPPGCGGSGLLLHRYRFDGTGTIALDSVGDADATLSGGPNAVQASGTLQLMGDSERRYAGGGYASLPPRVLTGLTSATFEAWISWGGNGPTGTESWQRVFDFGTQLNSFGTRYLFLTVADRERRFRVAFSLNGANDEVTVTAETPTPRDTVQHVAVVVDATASVLQLYVNGEQVDSASLEGQGKLADIDAENLWLGRSNYAPDPELSGSVLDFRIYGSALTSDDLRASKAAGPDRDFAQ